MMSKLIFFLKILICAIPGHCHPIVGDGISIGRPCCGEFACSEPLQNNRDRFCKKHFHMHGICAIVKCDQPVSESANGTVGTKTCANPEHKKIEVKNKERGASNFILKERFRQTQLSHPVNPMEVDEIQRASHGVEDVEDDVEWYEVNQSGKVSVHSKLIPGTVGVEDDAMEPVVPCPSKPATGNRAIKAQFG
jgi:hypothetical protein